MQELRIASPGETGKGGTSEKISLGGGKEKELQMDSVLGKAA